VVPDAFNQERDALNATIMDLASSLAEQEQAEEFPICSSMNKNIVTSMKRCN